MLQKLRIKFVAIVMASVAVVLAIVFTGIGVSEYQRSMSEVHNALEISLNRAVDGAFAPPDLFGGNMAFPDGIPDQGRRELGGAPMNGSEGVPSDFSGPRIGGRDDENRNMVPVGVYAIDGAGELTVVSGYTTALVDDDVLVSVTTIITAASDGYGELRDLGLIYQKRSVENMTYVAFADASNANGWQPLVLTLVISAIVVLAVFFVIALLLSRWALRPVEEAWNSQRQFVADASHELKTPLTVVLANTSILLKHSDDTIASQSQWIESTQVEAESMQGLVNEMLELAQIESRANALHEPLDFSDLVSGVVLQFESVAFERGCQFDEDIKEGLRVNGDEQRLRKMTSTLLENAMKYVDEGGAVKVKLSSAGNVAKLSITNTGSTIAPEDLPHIFDRFYRTDKARTSGAGGFGLGLAIARETAREHEGDIVCTSDDNGTTFCASIPLT